jgi:hypothetical protein
MQVIGQFSPEQEVYSIDESFLRFTPGEAAGLTALGLVLRARVLQWTAGRVAQWHSLGTSPWREAPMSA